MIRAFKTPFGRQQLGAYHRRVMHYCYRGVMCNKSPIDIALYLHLIHAVRPASLIELGSKFGGSAMLFRDIARMYQLDMQVISIDRQPPPENADFEGVSFLRGNVMNLDQVFAEHELFDLPRPWIVSEDSAHSYDACMRVLEFAARHLCSGDYLVMEDGVLAELGLADRFDGGPSRALQAFLTDNAGVFEIDTDYCDMFGQNATTNPNGYLRKV